MRLHNKRRPGASKPQTRKLQGDAGSPCVSLTGLLTKEQIEAAKKIGLDFTVGKIKIFTGKAPDIVTIHAEERGMFTWVRANLPRGMVVKTNERITVDDPDGAQYLPGTWSRIG